MDVVSGLEDVSVPFVTSHKVHWWVLYYTGRLMLHKYELGHHHLCYRLCPNASIFKFSWFYWLYSYVCEVTVGSAVTQDFTPSSARAFCTILDVFRVMVREMTLRHFFPSLLPLFNTSSGTPLSGPCNSRKRALVISTVSAQQTETGCCVYLRRLSNRTLLFSKA